MADIDWLIIFILVISDKVQYLIEDIIHIGKIPTEWEESVIVSPFKGKGAPPGAK